MDQQVKGDARRRVPGEASGAELQSMAPALAMGGAGPAEDSGCSASPLDAAPRVSCLEDVAPTVEPLKVGLDDDSSLEDGDEDMFDDDAFAFGDEDFQALMSHEAMRRMMHPPSPGGGSASAAPAAAAPHAVLPRHAHASFPAAKAAGAAEAGGDSAPSTRSSSFGEFERRQALAFDAHILRAYRVMLQFGAGRPKFAEHLTFSTKGKEFLRREPARRRSAESKL